MTANVGSTMRPDMKPVIVGVDPGTTEAGVVVWIGGRAAHPAVIPNGEVGRYIALHNPDVVAIEWIQAMGMVVGKTTFETCLWVGRFVEYSLAVGAVCRCIPRGLLKLHHCHDSRAKDSNIIQALKDKFGEKGTKAEPGFFHGVSAHAWQACAVAAYVYEGGESEKELRFCAVAN